MASVFPKVIDYVVLSLLTVAPTGRACQISNLNIISWKVTPRYESVNVSIVDIRISIFQGQSQVRASSSLSVGRVLSGKYAELFSCTELLD